MKSSLGDARLLAVGPEQKLAAAARTKIWREQNLDKARASEKRWRERNPEKVAAKKKAWRERNRARLAANDRAKRYGITAEDYDQLFASQGNVCGACGAVEPHGGRWCVDHCHATDRIRGIICMKCNFALGQADDSIDRLLDLINYLGRDRGTGHDF